MIKTAICILFFLLAVSACLIFRRNRIKSKQYKDFLSVFGNPNIMLPGLKFGWSYNWPTFNVKFLNKSDYEYALQNKMFELFDSKIEVYYNSEFRTDMAIYYSYPGKKVTT